MKSSDTIYCTCVSCGGEFTVDREWLQRETKCDSDSDIWKGIGKHFVALYDHKISDGRLMKCEVKLSAGFETGDMCFKCCSAICVKAARDFLRLYGDTDINVALKCIQESLTRMNETLSNCLAGGRIPYETLSDAVVLAGELAKTVTTLRKLGLVYENEKNAEG